MLTRSSSAQTGMEVLAGLVERVTFHYDENGFLRSAGENSGISGT
jgi:hypothetical protein